MLTKKKYEPFDEKKLIKEWEHLKKKTCLFNGIL